MSPSPPRARRRVVAATVALVAAGVVLASARQTPRPAPDDPRLRPTSTVAARKGEPVPVTGRADSFDRPDDPHSLGAMTGGGPAWRAGAGTWGVMGGEALVSRPTRAPAVAVVDRGFTGGAVQVRASRVVAGSGLAFAYRGPGQYWAVVAVPAYATWNVVRVREGRQETVANTGLSPVADGTTVAVRTAGRAVDVVLDGRVATTLDDATFQDTPLAGMTAAGPEPSRARFDDFRVAPPGGPG